MMKILIVDDSRVARNTLRKALVAGLVNVDFFEADDGETAWTIIQKEQPDLLFTDWYMENMSGLELTRKVREYNQVMKICVLTSETNPERHALVLEAGANSIMTKPFRNDKLAKVLQDLLG